MTGRAPPICDSHSHLTTSLMDVPDLERLAGLMARHGVEAMIACSFPFVTLPGPTWPYLRLGDDIIEAVAAALAPRVVPFLCGFNPAEQDARAYVDDGLSRRGFKGVGELIIHHGDWDGRLRPRPRIDAPETVSLLRLAGRHGAPVILHCDFDEMAGVEKALALAADTTVIWAHGGAVAGASPSPERLARALRDHPNLLIEISFDLWRAGFSEGDEGMPREGWRRLIESYPRRFTVGLDLSGVLEGFGEEVEKIRTMLASLSPDTACSVASGNLQRILGSRLP